MRLLTKEVKKAVETIDRAKIPCDVVINVLPPKGQRGIRNLFRRQYGVGLEITLRKPAPKGEQGGLLNHIYDDAQVFPGDTITLHGMLCGLQIGIGEQNDIDSSAGRAEIKE